MTKDRLKNIELLKTIAMIMVVLYHCMLFFNGEWFSYVEPTFNANYLNFITKWLGTLRLQTYTFTMASGFLFYYLKIEKNKYNNPKKDIVKRSKKLLLPYIITSILWVIPISAYFFKYSIMDMIKSFLLMSGHSQLWFLIVLFFIFIFFELFSDKIKMSTLNLIIIYIVSTTISMLLGYFDINFLRIDKVFSYLLFFYLGGFIYTNQNKIAKKHIIIISLLSIILLICIGYIDTLNIKIISYIKRFLIPIASACLVIIIYYLITKLVNKNKINFNNKLYKILEENSFGIYLFHQQLIYFCIILLNGVVHPIIQVILSFIITLIISILMSILLKKKKVTKTMFGL